MDHVGILKNAFRTTLRYRALWVLGFIWALVGGGNFGGGGGGGGGNNFEGKPGNMNLPHFDPGLIFGLIMLLCCLALVVGIITAVVRYVVQAGVYRTLAEIETAGVRPTVRGGWRQGWHRRTWRLFGQNLLIGIPLVLAFILLFLLAASPLLLLASDNDAAKVLGVALTVLLALVVIAVFVVVVVVVGVLEQFWWREAVLGDRDAITAIRSAWRLARANLRDVVIMWLLMFGVGLLSGLLMIPIILFVIALVAALAGGPGWLIYKATESLGAALLWGIPVGFVLFVVPLAFVGGLYLIFQASVWNQVYRQFVDRTSLAPLAQDATTPSVITP